MKDLRREVEGEDLEVVVEADEDPKEDLDHVTRREVEETREDIPVIETVTDVAIGDTDIGAAPAPILTPTDLGDTDGEVRKVTLTVIVISLRVGIVSNQPIR